MEPKENLCQPPEYPAEMFSEYIESAKARALRASEIEAILGDDYDLGRLRELVESDRDGRCVVLPFRPPKTVYSCSKRFPKPEQAHYASAINILWDMDRGCVFGNTPEEAEAALKGETHEDPV